MRSINFLLSLLAYRFRIIKTINHYSYSMNFTNFQFWTEKTLDKRHISIAFWLHYGIHISHTYFPWTSTERNSFLRKGIEINIFSIPYLDVTQFFHRINLNLRDVDRYGVSHPVNLFLQPYAHIKYRMR